ncbi:hypothetical protein [Pedobacter sp.]|jgi:hypothetical protein|uniref:hypothetical protein n=1 Tax=Pedobacter sp. TaxID=1411316 RepID=UPI002CE2C839|nr:hypothetical protein [Pedobacter sp.]HWW39574.1 hypothetical protein [Pedobacter sp.]
MYRKLVGLLVLISFFGLKCSKVYAAAGPEMNRSVESFCFETGSDGGVTSDTKDLQSPCSGEEEKDLKSFEFMDDDFIPLTEMKMFYTALSRKMLIRYHMSCPDPSIPAFYSPPESFLKRFPNRN